jgi:hypothetical protein
LGLNFLLFGSLSGNFLFLSSEFFSFFDLSGEVFDVLVRLSDLFLLCGDLLLELLDLSFKCGLCSTISKIEKLFILGLKITIELSSFIIESLSVVAKSLGILLESLLGSLEEFEFNVGNVFLNIVELSSDFFEGSVGAIEGLLVSSSQVIISDESDGSLVELKSLSDLLHSLSHVFFLGQGGLVDLSESLILSDSFLSLCIFLSLLSFGSEFSLQISELSVFGLEGILGSSNVSCNLWVGSLSSSNGSLGLFNFTNFGVIETLGGFDLSNLGISLSLISSELGSLLLFSSQWLEGGFLLIQSSFLCFHCSFESLGLFLKRWSISSSGLVGFSHLVLECLFGCFELSGGGIKGRFGVTESSIVGVLFGGFLLIDLFQGGIVLFLGLCVEFATVSVLLLQSSHIFFGLSLFLLVLGGIKDFFSGSIFLLKSIFGSLEFCKLFFSSIKSLSLSLLSVGCIIFLLDGLEFLDVTVNRSSVLHSIVIELFKLFHSSFNLDFLFSGGSRGILGRLEFIVLSSHVIGNNCKDLLLGGSTGKSFSLQLSDLFFSGCFSNFLLFLVDLIELGLFLSHFFVSSISLLLGSFVQSLDSFLLSSIISGIVLFLEVVEHDVLFNLLLSVVLNLVLGILILLLLSFLLEFGLLESLLLLCLFVSFFGLLSLGINGLIDQVFLSSPILDECVSFISIIIVGSIVSGIKILLLLGSNFVQSVQDCLILLSSFNSLLLLLFSSGLLLGDFLIEGFVSSSFLGPLLDLGFSCSSEVSSFLLDVFQIISKD